MGFEKEHKQGKGRPKGAENKVTKAARDIFLETLEGQAPHIAEAFKDVRCGVKDNEDKVISKPDPKGYLDLFAKYAQYFVPKKTENTDKIDLTVKDFNIKDVLNFDKPKS